MRDKGGRGSKNPKNLRGVIYGWSLIWIALRTCQLLSLLQDSIGLAEMFSVESYPEPYCGIVDGMATACLEMSVLELWANDGAFDRRTEQELAVWYKETK